MRRPVLTARPSPSAPRLSARHKELINLGTRPIKELMFVTTRTIWADDLPGGAMSLDPELRIAVVAAAEFIPPSHDS
jgi:hypothetical protein